MRCIFHENESETSNPTSRRPVNLPVSYLPAARRSRRPQRQRPAPPPTPPPRSAPAGAHGVCEPPRPTPPANQGPPRPDRGPHLRPSHSIRSNRILLKRKRRELITGVSKQPYTARSHVAWVRLRQNCTAQPHCTATGHYYLFRVESVGYWKFQIDCCSNFYGQVHAVAMARDLQTQMTKFQST